METSLPRRVLFKMRTLPSVNAARVCPNTLNQLLRAFADLNLATRLLVNPSESKSCPTRRVLPAQNATTPPTPDNGHHLRGERLVGASARVLNAVGVEVVADVQAKVQAVLHHFLCGLVCFHWSLGLSEVPSVTKLPRLSISINERQRRVERSGGSTKPCQVCLEPDHTNHHKTGFGVSTHKYVFKPCLERSPRSWSLFHLLSQLSTATRPNVDARLDIETLVPLVLTKRGNHLLHQSCHVAPVPEHLVRHTLGTHDSLKH